MVEWRISKIVANHPLSWPGLSGELSPYIHENIEGIPKAKEWMLRHDVNICKLVSEVAFVLFWFVGDAIDRKPLRFL